MALTSDDLGVGDLGGFYQDVPSVSPGTEYTFSAQIGTYGYSLDTVTILKIEWFSGGGTSLGAVESQVTEDTEASLRILLSITDIAPTATTHARVSALKLNTATLTSPTFALFDDFRFSETPTVPTVPEPSSTALLGLGGLALMLRRRR